MEAKSSHIKAANEVLEFIHHNNNFLVSAHINADGDAIASVIAMGILLAHLKKKYYMVLHDTQIDVRFAYLKNFRRSGQ